MSTALDIPQVNPEPHEIISIIHDIQTPPETLVPYQNLSLIKKLNNNKFPINLVFCQASQQYYVMKVFPYLGRYIHPNFSNELRFTPLSHPNIVNFVHSETKDDKLQGDGKKASYILMEYAPYGDFCNFIGNYGEKMDEKLVRTYFRQLIEGVEHLHKNGVVHLDLKPDNLLLGADFNLKITDFDLSYKQGDTKVSSNGTKYLRAPEFFRQKTSGSTSKATCAADIYSAGIILFILKSRGHYPHTEDTIYKGINLIDLMYNDNEKFWEKHCKMGRRDGAFFEESFRELFNKMTKENSGERVSISEIKESEWYNGPVYTPGELTNKMKELLNC